MKKILLVLLLIVSVNFIVFKMIGRILNRTVTPAPPQISEEAKALHRKLVIADMHADSLLWGRDLNRRGSWGHVDVPRLIEGNVALQAFTVVTENATPLAIVDAWPMRTWGSMTERALYQAGKFQQLASSSGGKLTIIRSREDLKDYLERRLREPGITAGFLGVEGAQSLDGHPANLDRLYGAGFRMVGITHFSDNEFGSSSGSAHRGGLTESGRALVKQMEEKGILIDLAHSSQEVIQEVLALVRRPVIVSHTGVQGTCHNSRNLSDDSLKGIARNGGLIGIGYWDTATCGKDVEAIVRAIRYTVTLIGADHVGLGSDFDGGITAPFDTAALTQLTSALIQNKFTEDEIRKIMGENLVRLLQTNLP